MLGIDSDVECNGSRWLKQLQANPAWDISAIGNTI